MLLVDVITEDGIQNNIAECETLEGLWDHVCAVLEGIPEDGYYLTASFEYTETAEPIIRLMVNTD